MGKILWLDLETSGLSSWKNDIIQLAALFELGGKVIDEINLLMKPLNTDRIEQEALKVQRRSAEEVLNYRPTGEQINHFKKWMENYVDPYNKNDKFILAGYFIGFDDDFLRATFRKLKDNYYGSWFISAKMDVASFVAEALTTVAVGMNHSLPDYKLATICKHFDIKFEAHDALEDVKATRKLYRKLKGLDE